MVHPEVREDVPDEKIGKAIVLADPGECAEGNDHSKIAQKDKLLVFLLVQRARRDEVVDAASGAVLHALAFALGLPLVVVVTGHIEQDIRGPTAELLEDAVEGGGNGCLLGQLVELVCELADARSVLIPRLWHENHVALHVAGSLVVLAVGDLPREVGDEEGRVANPANGVVERLGRREGLVAALVGKHPQTGSEKTLHKSVASPQGRPCGCRRNRLRSHIVVEEVEGGGQRSDIASNVAEATQTGALEAVGGNGIAELLDGEIWEFKLVAVCVEQLAVRLLCLELVDGAERGERGAGRGASGRVHGGNGHGVHVGGGGPLQNRVLGSRGGGGHFR